MKLAVCLFLYLVLVAVATSSDDPKQLFEDFVAKYNKNYLTLSEKLVRFEIFKANLALIEQYNKLEQGTAVYGVTEFTDMSPDEFKARYTGFHAPLSAEFPQAKTLSTNDLPTSIDWRSKGAVTEVKNQGQCGSCWSFSTTGNVEGQWFLAGHSLVSLSEQQLVDCDTVDQGCNGGLPSNAYQYIIKAGGIMSEDSYSYKAAGGKCQFSSSKIVAKISNWTSVSTDEDQIAAYLVAHGPLSIGINAGPMQFYFGGVSDPWFCNPKSLDHGVLIVGYGVDGTKPYWIIKNSWGASWGEKGYYRIVRGKGKCGLNTMVTSALV